MFGRENGQDCCFRLKYRANDNSGYFIQCENVDWDGAEFGRSIQGHHIFSFEGTKPITQLEVFPLQFYPKKENAKEKLISRGKKFEELRHYQYKAYDGVGLWDQAQGQGQSPSRKLNVSILITLGTYFRVIYLRISKEKSRVIIDAQSYHRLVGPPTGFVSLTEEGEQATHLQQYNLYVQQQPQLVQPPRSGVCQLAPYAMSGLQRSGAICTMHNAPDDDETVETAIPRLTEEQLLLASPLVKGFSMKTKDGV
jgi:hypothetical protein